MEYSVGTSNSDTGGVLTRLAARGESILSLQVLGCLSRPGPVSQGELAQSAGQHPTGMSRLLDGLEQARLLRRGLEK